MVIDPNEFKATLRLWASGVTVVTTAVGEERTGMTVSAFNSLTLEPPSIIVCMNKSASVPEMLGRADSFAVSILSSDQSHLSDRFSGRIPLAEGETRFDGLTVMTAQTGAPILADALAWLDCKISAVHEAGTHLIVIGEVVASGQHPNGGLPLIYYDRDYRSLQL